MTNRTGLDPAQVDSIDLDQITLEILATAKEQGYTVRQTKDETAPSESGGSIICLRRWNLHHEERGVRICFFTTHVTDKAGITMEKRAKAEISRRTDRGRYPIADKNNTIFGTKRGMFGPYVNDDWKEWLKHNVSIIVNARGEAVTDPIAKGAGLAAFPPMKFDKSAYSIKKDGTNNLSATVTNFYASCRVKGVATVMPDLKVSVDNTMTPGAEPWFYITGSCGAKRSGASPEIIVSEQDGELVFYPVLRGKVSSELKPQNTYIDYNLITEIDGTLVQMAIQKFLDDLNGNA